MSLITDIFSGIENALLGIGSSTIAAVTKGPTGDTRAGDITISAITLISEDQQRQYDLLSQCKSFEIFESISSPAIFAELSIADSIGLYQSFPIIGEEYVSISFKTPGSQTNAKYLLRVNKIMNKQVNAINKMVTYTLQLVSAEVIRNAVQVVNRPYNDSINNIVNTILTLDLQTSKPISIDPTIGIEQGLLTNTKPFKAIDFLRRRAVSSKYKSSAFVFYESRDGYVFSTVEHLINKGKQAVNSGATDKTFFFDTARHENISTVDIRNIVAYNQTSFGDTITKAVDGGIYNQVSSFDMITGSMKKNTFLNDGTTAFQGLDQTSSPVNTAGFISKHGRTTSVMKLIPINSALATTTRVDRTGALMAFAHQITQNIVNVFVYGDSELRVGDVIGCTFPAATGADNTGSARLESGNYLVSKVRHMVVNSDRPQHMIAMELMKGDFAQPA